MLASASEQMEHEKSVPLAFVPGELFAFADDLFRPKQPDYVASFTEDELCDLAHLYGLVRESSLVEVATVVELLKQPSWRRVRAVAKEVGARLDRAS
jgi:hypothetical protein